MYDFSTGALAARSANTCVSVPNSWRHDPRSLFGYVKKLLKAFRKSKSGYIIPCKPGTPLHTLRHLPPGQGPDYESAVDRRRRKNMRAARRELLKQTGCEKIERYIAKHGIRTTYQQLRARFSDPVVYDFAAAAIAKDPGRQSIHQKLALRFLRTLGIFESIEELLAGTKESQIVDKGMVKPASDLEPKKRARMRSLDFKAILTLDNGHKIDVYISHKYTGKDGGAQNHQRDDLFTQMKQAALNRSWNELFLLIADGEYYQKNRKGLGKPWIRVMNDHSNNFNAFALTIGQVGPFLNYYRTWRSNLEIAAATAR